MGDRRMMSLKVIDSDAFLDMALSTQAVYMHLLMRADDDGFVNNVKKIKRMICASDDDIKLLIAKGFIIPFETGVVVIKHWRVHNIIRKDLYHPTIYQDEKATLIPDKTGTYRIRNESVPESNRISTEDEPEQYPNKESKDNKTKLNKNNKENIRALFDESSLSEPVKDKVIDFLAYRDEIKKPFKSERGIKSLITQIEKQEQAIGSMAVISVIDTSMQNGWQGLFWDKAPKKQNHSSADMAEIARLMDEGVI